MRFDGLSKKEKTTSMVHGDLGKWDCREKKKQVKRPWGNKKNVLLNKKSLISRGTSAQLSAQYSPCILKSVMFLFIL